MCNFRSSFDWCFEDGIFTWNVSLTERREALVSRKPQNIILQATPTYSMQMCIIDNYSRNHQHIFPHSPPALMCGLGVLNRFFCFWESAKWFNEFGQATWAKFIGHKANHKPKQRTRKSLSQQKTVFLRRLTNKVLAVWNPTAIFRAANRLLLFMEWEAKKILQSKIWVEGQLHFNRLMLSCHPKTFLTKDVWDHFCYTWPTIACQGLLKLCLHWFELYD